MSGAKQKKTYAPPPPLLPGKAPKLDGIAPGLIMIARWILWRLEPKADGTSTKVPYGLDGFRVGWDNEKRARAAFALIAQVVRQGRTMRFRGQPDVHVDFSGPGFVLGPLSQKTLRVIGLDFDTCLDKDGNPYPWAKKAFAWIAGRAYAEVSPSGTGVKVFLLVAEADVPEIVKLFEIENNSARFVPNVPHTGGHPPCVDLFIDGKYFTVTGERWSGCADDIKPGVTLADLKTLRGVLPLRAQSSAGTGGGPKDGSALALGEAGKLVNDGKVAMGDIDGLRAALLKSAEPEVVRWTTQKGGTDAYGVRQLQRVFDRLMQPAPWDVSHNDLALRFVDRHQDDLRYVAAWGKWIRRVAHGWADDTKRKVFDLARTLCREAANGLRGDLARKVKSAAWRAAVLNLAGDMDEIATDIDEWDVDPRVLNTPDGIVDLTTGLLRERKPDELVRKCTKVSPAAAGADCPRWMEFLDRVTAGDKDLQAYLQRVVGYCLTGLTTEHVLFFCYGTGRNGKGTFLNTLYALLGSYAHNSSMETFSTSRNERHTTELAELVGRRLVIAPETEEGKAWNEVRIKALTGGDPITARFMRQDNFTFWPVLKLAISGNYKPALRSVDPAIKARLQMIPFLVFIPEGERNLNLKEELIAEEGPGILRWAIEGCLEWQRVGLKPPKAVTAATDEYLSSEDVHAQWLEERWAVVGEKANPTDNRPIRADDFATTHDLFQSWTDFATIGGYFVGTEKLLVGKMGRFKPDRRLIPGAGWRRGFLGLGRRGQNKPGSKF